MLEDVLWGLENYSECKPRVVTVVSTHSVLEDVLSGLDNYSEWKPTVVCYCYRLSPAFHLKHLTGMRKTGCTADSWTQSLWGCRFKKTHEFFFSLENVYNRSLVVRKTKRHRALKWEYKWWERWDNVTASNSGTQKVRKLFLVQNHHWSAVYS